MFKEHKTFIQPANEQIKIWRYMDFTKLISMIDTETLFFTRADGFEDIFEGSWPKVNVTARSSAPEDMDEESKEKYLAAMNNLPSINKQWLRYAAINCWHENEVESAAMWKLYLKSEEGIAVQTTYENLKNSIKDAEEVYIGKVTYIDYETQGIDAGNILGPFVHKRKSFEHEREIRALLMKWPPTIDNKLDYSKETITGGVAVQVDINRLIEKIYVAPSSPSWFVNLVQKAVKKYGFSIKIVQSDLDKSPVY